MSVPARRIGLGYVMNERTALDAKVNHLQRDITDLKAEVQRIDAKVDGVSANLTEHRVETERSFGQVREEIAKLRTELKDSIAALRIVMKDAFTEFRRDRTVQIAWVIGTVVAAIGSASAVAMLFDRK